MPFKSNDEWKEHLKPAEKYMLAVYDVEIAGLKRKRHALRKRCNKRRSLANKEQSQ